MLGVSDTDIQGVVGLLARHGIEACFLVPTVTGINKSIMDATAPVRAYLRDKGVHDYEFQCQGPGHKKTVEAYLVLDDKVTKSTASLYRPVTKKGDPRIWFSNLKRYASPKNLLVIIAHCQKLYVVNASNVEILQSINCADSPLGQLASSFRRPSVIADELLGKLRDISAMGFVKSRRRGDTGVGMTLESLLGIEANVSKKPDYKGIEIKSSRRRPGKVNRSTLFSQVPSWKESAVPSAKQLLEMYGYERSGRRQLYCTLGSTSPNSQGLFLSVGEDDDYLHNLMRGADGKDTKVVVWPLEKLRRRLTEKHPETFWVKAKTRKSGNKEYFHYIEVIHTRSPIASYLENLVDAGDITVDYTLSLRQTGTVRDHGYLFKIHPDKLGLLFPSPRQYQLQA